MRYIAINDNIDRSEDNDIAPFKNILNEMYAKDISKSVIRLHRVGGVNQVPYLLRVVENGYLKRPLYPSKYPLQLF